MSIRSRVAAVLFAVVLVVPVAAVSPAVGAAAAGSGLPACAYRDVIAAERGYSLYSRTLLDTIHMVPRTYAPGDLRSTGVAGGGQLRSVAIGDLRGMFAAARRAGAALMIKSSYRSYATQVSTFNYWVRVEGYRKALLTSARPGHSEHQLGTAVDVTSYGGKAPWLYSDWGTTKAGAWMRTNAWTFGFVMSYPKGKSPSVTCYKYEPWHFRYVGKATAKAIHASGLTPREWIWLHPTGLPT
jgi:D-alanyl-D-alanine carboxypeptidase